jgi:hypothetical protein
MTNLVQIALIYVSAEEKSEKKCKGLTSLINRLNLNDSIL